MDTVASSTLALTVLQPAIEAPKFLTSWEGAFSEEGATFSALGGLPAISASIGVGAFSSPHEKTFFSSATPTADSRGWRHLDITPTSHGETIDLNDYATGTVRIFVSGGGALTVTHASAAQSIEVAEGVKAELTLSYDGSTSAAPVHQTLRLDGATDVSLKLDPNPIVAAAMPTADLVVDSQGATGQ